MKEVNVYVEKEYVVLKIPFSEIIENKGLFDFLKRVRAEELKKKIHVDEESFNKLLNEFNDIIREKVENWLKEIKK